MGSMLAIMLPRLWIGLAIGSIFSVWLPFTSAVDGQLTCGTDKILPYYTTTLAQLNLLRGYFWTAFLIFLGNATCCCHSQSHTDLYVWLLLCVKVASYPHRYFYNRVISVTKPQITFIYIALALSYFKRAGLFPTPKYTIVFDCHISIAFQI